MKLIKTGMLALLLTIFGPVAVAQEEGDSDMKESEERVCISSNRVRTFDAINDNYVYVGESANRHYLLTMWNRCLGLRHAQGIALKDTTSRICSGGFGEIVYRDRAGGGRMASCRIGKIERLENRDQAKERVEEYTKEQSDTNKGIDEAEK
jgi:hypothetical protein